MLDDAGYADVYLLAGRAYRLVQRDHLGTLQWEVDNVQGGGGASGLGVAGIGVGSSTVALSPGAGVAQASATVFPPDTLGVALTLWVDTSLGTSQGLTHVGVGTASVPDRWGVLRVSLGQCTAGYESTAGLFEAYSGQPQPLGAEPITLTAYGGRFDGTGRVYLTGHYMTFRPNHQAGSVYLPGLPGDTLPQDPLPLATELVPGIVELIAAAEVLEDTDLTRALTIGRLVSRTGTPTRLGLLRTATPAAVVTGTNDTDASTPLGVKQALDARVASETAAGLVELTTPAETVTGTDSTRATHAAGVKAALDTRVPAGTALSVPRYTPGGVTLEASPLSVDASSNLRLGSVVAGTSLASGLVLPSGTAPTTSPPDAVQLWVADQLGSAGQAALHLRSEDGSVASLGKGLLTRMRTVTLTTNGVGSPYVLTTDQSGLCLIGNGGTEIQAIQLPATPGATYVGVYFTVVNNQPSPRGTRLLAASGQFIRIGTLTSTAGGTAQTLVAGDYVVLLCYSAGIWTALSPQLGWTVT